MSKTRFVAFATQKGGIGKSTITALVANYIHNVKGFNVAVIDCDEPQHNIADLRDEEMELIKDSVYFKAMHSTHLMTQRKCWRNLRLNPTLFSLTCREQSKAKVS